MILGFKETIPECIKETTTTIAVNAKVVNSKDLIMMIITVGISHRVSQNRKMMIMIIKTQLPT